MAPPDGAEPPVGSSNKTYKCCNQTKAKTLLYIVCETMYHVGHFKPINGAENISDTLIICDQHTVLDLTSKLDHVLMSADYQCTKGPFLWTCMYDGLLRMKLPNVASLVRFADDLALLVVTEKAWLVEIIANEALELMADQ